MSGKAFYWGLLLEASGALFIAFLLFSLASTDPATVECAYDPYTGTNVCEEIYHD